MQASDRENFDEAVSKLSLEAAYETIVNGVKIRFLLTHSPVPNAFEIATRLHNCRECGRRYAFFSNISGGGKPVFSVSNFLTDDAQYIALDDLARNACSTHPVSILVIKPNDAYLRYNVRAGVSLVDSLPFHHYHFQIPNDLRSEIKDKNAKHKIYDLFADAVHRYLTAEDEPIITRLIAKIAMQGEESIRLLSETLSKVNYGNTYKAAVSWMTNVIVTWRKNGTPLENFLFKIDMISSAGICQDANGAVCPILHSALHLMDLLDDAGSMDELRKTLSVRLDPHNYRRKTAEASVGQLRIAQKVLGSFRGRVMSIDEASKQKGWIPIGTAQKVDGHTSAGDALATLLRQKATTSVKTKSFAERVGERAIISQIQGIKSFEAFKNFILQHPEAVVSLNSISSLSPVYHILTVDAEGVPTKFDYIRQDIDYLWGFGGITFRKSNLNVCGILQTCVGRFNNFVLCLSEMDSEAINITSGCFFPEFLATHCASTCGKAFEDLNNFHESIIRMPEKTPFAVGYGTSAINDMGELARSVSLKVTNGSYSAICTLSKARE